MHEHIHVCMRTHTYKHVCILFQYGPYSDVSEITTAAGPPGQCKAPCISFTPDGCVLVSWEVSQTRVLYQLLFLLLYLPQMQVRRNLQSQNLHVGDFYTLISFGTCFYH